MKFNTHYGFLLSICLLLFLGESAYAQYPPGGKSRQYGGNQGHLFGRVEDSTGNRLEDVTVMVLQISSNPATNTKKETLIRTTYTDKSGRFEFEGLPVAGQLKLKIIPLGYIKQELIISFMKPAAVPGGEPTLVLDKDMGTIMVSIDPSNMTSVEVVAEEQLIKFEGDKKVYAVGKDLSVTGGTAVDVMKNVPGVVVDLDGNVSMRNTAPQIFVNGRPTELTLDQIPADAIERVEILSNPGAQYDASGGGAGILNIILKKDKRVGYNGNARAGVDRYKEMFAGADFSLRQEKWAFNLSVNGRLPQDVSYAESERREFQQPPYANTYQDNVAKRWGQGFFGKVGIDFLADPRNTLSISANRVMHNNKNSEEIDINSDSTYFGKIQYFTKRESEGYRNFGGWGSQLAYKHIFKRAGEEITADANYFGGNSYGMNSYDNRAYLLGSPDLLSFSRQNQGSNGSFRNMVFQTDYTRPLAGKSKLEAGLRSSMRLTTNNISNTLAYSETGPELELPGYGKNYRSTDNVYAAYVTYSGALSDWTYKLGLRAESSDYAADLLNENKRFSVQYPISLFPSLFLTRTLSASKTEIQLSVTRRVNRPNFFQLMPYTDYTDKLNINRGNPALKPEFTQGLELSALQPIAGRSTLLLTGYYRYTNNLITRYLVTEYDPTLQDNAVINTYINANASHTEGVELTSQNRLTGNFDVTANFNGYRSTIITGIQGSEAVSRISYFAKLTANYKFKHGWFAQVSGFYQSKSTVPSSGGMERGFMFGMQSGSAAQGYIKPYGSVDLSIRKAFLANEALSLTLQFSDIFRTRYMTTYSLGNGFEQTYSRIRSPQNIRLTLSYKFGKQDPNLLRRKNTNSESIDAF